MTAKYAAVMEQADAGGFGVWFPDFPGCVTHADDAASAAQAARRVLGRHIERMAENGEPAPRPTPAEAVELAHDLHAYVFLVETDTPAAQGPYLRLNVTLPEALVRRIDAVAGGNRSGWLAMAAGEQLKRYTTVPNYAASMFSGRDKR